jgi:hypothetical protein
VVRRADTQPEYSMWLAEQRDQPFADRKQVVNFARDDIHPER